MLWGNALLPALISLLALQAPPAQSTVTLYRVELAGGEVLWAKDQPRDSGTSLLFHQNPSGLLVSVKSSTVKHVTAARVPAGSARKLKPGGEIIVLGPTGGGPSPGSAGKPGTGGGAGAAGSSDLLPGERKDGTALLNPDRQFKPEWDTKQVPGLNLPYPNSSNDYREGKTFAYPPAPAVQQSPGDVPKMPPGNGELPRGPGSK